MPILKKFSHNVKEILHSHQYSQTWIWIKPAVKKKIGFFFQINNSPKNSLVEFPFKIGNNAGSLPSLQMHLGPGQPAP